MASLSHVKVYLDQDGHAVAAELDGKRLAGVLHVSVGSVASGTGVVTLVLEQVEVLAAPAHALEPEKVDAPEDSPKRKAKV